MDPDFPYSDPNFPYSDGSSGRNLRSGHSHTGGADLARAVDTPGPEAGPTPVRHAGHSHWMHVLMCAPMLLVVGYLLLAGKVGGGAILYALSCMIMMGAMMAMMDRGSGNHSRGH